jgi:hypothetical protein
MMGLREELMTKTQERKEGHRTFGPQEETEEEDA